MQTVAAYFRDLEGLRRYNLEASCQSAAHLGDEHPLYVHRPPPLHRVPAPVATAERRLYHREAIAGVQNL